MSVLFFKPKHNFLLPQKVDGDKWYRWDGPAAGKRWHSQYGPVPWDRLRDNFTEVKTEEDGK